MTEEEIIRGYRRPMVPIATTLARTGSPRRPVRAVLFDVYGTLFISRAGDIGGAQAEAGERIGMIDDLVRRHRLKPSARSLLDRYFCRLEEEKNRLSREGVEYPEVAVEAIWGDVLGWNDGNLVRRFALEFEMITNPVHPMPGLEECLASLKERGKTLGIISNAQFYTPLLFSAYLGNSHEGLGFRKDLVFLSYELGVGKPSPVAFRKAAQRLEASGISRGETVYVGNDLLKDIRPSGETGFQTVLFAGDARSLNLREDDERCRNIIPDMIVTDLRQLPELMQ